MQKILHYNTTVSDATEICFIIIQQILIVWSDQNLSKPRLKVLTVSVETT